MPVTVPDCPLEHLQAVSIARRQETHEGREGLVVLLNRGKVELDRASGVGSRAIRDTHRHAVDRDGPSRSVLVDDGSQPGEPVQIGSPSANGKYGDSRALLLDGPGNLVADDLIGQSKVERRGQRCGEGIQAPRAALAGPIVFSAVAMMDLTLVRRSRGGLSLASCRRTSEASNEPETPFMR